MWNYIYYSVYLETIDISDHNAIEKYVYQKVSALPCRSVSVEITQCRENDGCYFPLSHSILSIQIQSSSIDFFPLFKTLSLEGVKDDADARQLEALQSTVRMVLEKVGRARQRKGRKRDGELDRVGGRVAEEYLPLDTCTASFIKFFISHLFSSGAAEVKREGTEKTVALI